jgi:hypothetical protein
MVHSTLVEPKRFSLIPPDTKEREVSRPMWPTSGLWRPGFIYAHSSLRWHRIAVERFAGRFEVSAGVRAGVVRVDGQPDTVLFLEN